MWSDMLWPKKSKHPEKIVRSQLNSTCKYRKAEYTNDEHFEANGLSCCYSSMKLRISMVCIKSKTLFQGQNYSGFGLLLRWSCECCDVEAEHIRNKLRSLKGDVSSEWNRPDGQTARLLDIWIGEMPQLDDVGGHWSRMVEFNGQRAA